MQQAYLYRWTHIPTKKWYVGSRTAIGCHPDDGYICSNKIVKPMIFENRIEWVRDILVIGPSEYIRNLEELYLTLLNAATDPESFNRNNGTGKAKFKRDAENPMKDPVIAKKNHELTTGDKHWTANLNGKTHPQKGQKRPTIQGNNHPNKRPENAAKISASHKGKAHVYQIGEKNVMHRLEVKQKFKGDNHWSAKLENRRTCEHCGLLNISKSNYTRWHGSNCKHKGKK